VARPPGHARTRTVVTIAGGVVALLLPLVLVPLITGSSWQEIFGVLGDLTAAQVGVLGLVWLAGMFVHTYVSTGALPGLTHRKALVLNFSGSTVSHLAPFGGVLGMGLNYTMLRSWGFDGIGFSVLTLITNAWNVVVKLLLPALALAVILAFTQLGVHGLVTTSLVSLALLGAIAALVWIALRPKSTDETGRIHRLAAGFLERISGSHGSTAISTLRDDVRHRVRTQWLRMALGMFGYALLQASLLWLCVRAVGGGISPAGVFAAYAMGAALTLVPITPGGVGFAEAGTAALLVAFGEAPPAAAAAVLVYATFTRWMEIPFGAAGMAWWWARRPRSIELFSAKSTEARADCPEPDLPIG